MIISNSKTRKAVLLIFKIFFVGLILQFFLQTFVTFQLGWNNIFWKIVRSWKEIFVVIGSMFLLYVFVNKFNFRKFKGLKTEIINRRYELKLNKMPIIKFIIVFLITFIITFIISLIIKKVGIGNYILSVKYDLLGFFIFILSFVIAWLFLKLEDFNIVTRYNKLFKTALVGAFFWWVMVWLIPNFLKFFGYNQFNFEGTIGSRPPAAYYTMINQGYVRNQFLFERPINFGFFLIALWPVFFFSVLRGKSKKEMRGWSLFYGLIVISTLSRAAIGVRLGITVIMILLMYFNRIKKIFRKLLIPVLLIFVGVGYFYKPLVIRQHSNIGHTKLLVEGLGIIGKNPVRGRGAGYAGPASHQICYQNTSNPICDEIKQINNKYEISTIGFNPENQYIQIWIEYGIFGFIGWIIMFVWLHFIGYKAWIDENKKNFSKSIRAHSWIIIGFALGLLGLAIEGIVLHSFVDRMIVYPFMAMFGLAYALYYKETNERDFK
ncbi:MAG: O-antigen ligase family protein [Candidatus Absconditicoccaceae bacterium]